MKNKKGLLACTLGLMLGVGTLAGCGGTANEYTVTFKEGNEELHVEKVKEGDLCPEYVPDSKEGYDFMGWYETRQHTGDAFDFENTEITSDLTLYAWYKEPFARSTLTFFVVGSFSGGKWDGEGTSAEWGDRKMVLNEAEQANEKNVFEYTIESINFGEKFRMILSTDGETSDGWTEAYGFDIVNKIYDPEGNELVNADTISEEDFKNIGVKVSGKLKISLNLNSDFNAVGEITLTYLEITEIVYPEYVSLVGVVNTVDQWSIDTELTSADEGDTWSVTVTFAVNDAWKLRMNHGWDVSWGYGNMTASPEGAFVEGQTYDEDGEPTGANGNIVVLVAGTYVITFTYLTNSIVVTEAPAN